MFAHPNEVGPYGTDPEMAAPPAEPAPVKRPSRLSPLNWPVRWRVFAIALVPLVLAAAFGGLRVYTSAVEARDLRLASERAEMAPAVADYLGALENALTVGTEGGDLAAAMDEFNTQKARVEGLIAEGNVESDVMLAANTLINYGQELLVKVEADSIDLRQRILDYAPLLLTAETAINGSVRVDDETIRTEAQALARAVGARGQMMIQRMAVERGAELPEPILRASMIAIAGTEPAAVTGMAEVLGAASSEAGELRSQMVQRLAVYSDPANVLVNNPTLLSSIDVTDGIARGLISDLSTSITTAVDNEAAAQRNAAIRDAILVALAFVIALIVVWLVARSLTRPLRRLRDAALKVAHEDLEREIADVRAGQEPGPVPPIPVQTTEEVGQVAHAVDELHTQALLLAGDEARLRLQVNDMFETLSRRNKSLVDQQLSLIDRLERNEDDPDRLHSLFRLDHLATRMRRNGANLLVLAGARVARELNDSVSVATAVSAAASEVEDYQRVEQGMIPDATLVGSVTGDVIHLLAELIDNALRYSPPTDPVRVTAVHTSNGGLIVEIIDTGIGMTDTDLRIANMRLGSGVDVTPDNTRHMGLFVVGRLSQQHGITVRLKPSAAAASPAGPASPSGTTVEVYLPPELLASSPAQHRGTWQSAQSLDGPAPVEEPSQPIPVVAAAPSLVKEPEPERDSPAEPEPAAFANGASPLPRRNPGASGITDEGVFDAGVFPPAQSSGPANTSAFFSARAQARQSQDDTGAHEQIGQAEYAAPTPPRIEPRLSPVPDMPEPEPEPEHAFDDVPEPVSEPSAADPFGVPFDEPDDSDSDPIYQKMLSEWLVDPVSLANTDRDWKSVWDSGWSAAENAEEAPVAAHTDHGLPVREPGLRLVPGTVRSDEPRHAVSAAVANGSHHGANGSDRVISSDRLEPNPQERDPSAVRASLSSHFGGVRAGRTHARDTDEGVDAE